MLAVHQLLWPSGYSNLKERINILCCAAFSLFPCKLRQMRNDGLKGTVDIQ